VSRPRILALIFAGATALCLIGLRGARTQSIGLRRVTDTTEEGININPSISGDGRVLAFESTEDIAGAGGTDHFRAIRANIAVDPATLLQMGGTRAVAPAISRDGSRIAFASKDDPLTTNPDGNSEIFLCDGAKLTQVTNTSPGDLANRVTNGNFQPSVSDDGRFIAFSSNRDLAGQNADANLEIFIYDALVSSFTQLTNTSGIVGSSDAKISGNGAIVAYIRDSGTTPSAERDLLEQLRTGFGPATVLAEKVRSLAMTYGRAISSDGTRVVYSAEIATNSDQVFLFDGRGGTATRQITSLGVRTTEVPLHPTISGDGTHIAFAARRSVPGAPANSDGGVELYVLDIPSSQLSKITNAPANATADVVSSLNDDGSIVAFNFPRLLSGAVANSDSANNSEIYVTGTPSRPPFGAITVLNGASFGKEPSTTKAIAPDSIAVAIGGALANSTRQSQKFSNGTFPTNLGGTTVTVNGRAAQILFVSPGQVNFLVPSQTEIGTADVVVANSENFTSVGTVPTLRSAPGVFTTIGFGAGPGVILNSEGLQEGPFDPTNGNLRLTIFATGARNASQAVVSMGGRVVNAELVLPSPDMAGLDEVTVLVPADLRGAGTVDLFIQSDSRASNPVSVTFSGDSSRDIALNEVLVDPPPGTAGDANHDGTRDSSQDEFVEFVNATTRDLDISGYQLFTRSSTTTTDTLQHTFAGGTILPACSAIVVFGGGTFDPANPVFGGSQVVKASTNGLSLTNSGGVVTLHNQSGAIVTFLSYGGSTALNGQANQSLTRSPDVTGPFTLHQSATGNGGRAFSPGTQVNGAPFIACPPIARIDVSPSSAAIEAGAKQQFTAQGFDSANNPVAGVIFSWQSSNTSVATIDQNGLATSSTAGSTEIRAFARGVQSAPATLTVREVQRVLMRVDVTPESPTIPAAGAQQFTARGIDQFGNEIIGLTFAWESSNTSAATIDQTGLATGIAQGQSTIKATAQNVSGTATLNVSAPTVVVNEVLADPPTGINGDANRDGTRDSSQDEFVELVNSTGGGINISEWTVRTHSTTSSTETVRHTFAANTTLPAGQAMLVFGGGTFNPGDPLFGCAQVVKASSGGLSLTNGGLTILVRDGSGNLVTQLSYGGTTGLNGGNAQSLTRSPDITGNFVLHTTIAGARTFSAGLQTDGTPFGNCPGHPATVTISPPSSTINVGQTTQFTAQAFDQFGRAMTGVAITFASDNTSAAPVDSVATNPSTGIATANVSAHNPGTAHINASVTDGTTTAHSPQAALTVNGPSLRISDVSLNEGDSGATTFTFTVSLSQPAPNGGVTFNIATQDGTATTANNDYVARSLTGQTVAAGQSTYAFAVTVNGDLSIEPNETFFVNVTNVTGASVADAQGIGTILNDDSPSLSVNDVLANEGNGGTTTFRFTVTSTLSAPAGGITFDITTADGTATTAGGDYVPRSLTNQTIPAGQQTYTFDVTVNGDTLVEPNETFTVNITNVSGASVADASAMGIIQNDDTASLVISQVYGGGDNSGAPFRNDFVEIYNHGVTTVDFSITPYSIQSASVGSSFGTNKTNLTVGMITPGRYFLVQESGGTTNGVALPTPDATGTIAMAGTAGKVALVAGTTALATATCPGDDGTSPFNPSSAAIADLVGYGNSATTTGHCYEGPGPAPTPSNTTAAFRKAGGCVDTDDNAADFFVATPNPRNTSSPIGDCKPDVTINDVTVTEGNTGTVNATFTVTLSAASANTVTVNFATAGGTATHPADYQSTSGTLTFNPGDLTKTITVLVNGDPLDEPNETFFVNLTNATNGVIVDNQGQGTINDNDPTPSLSINDLSVAEGDAGTTPATFTVTLSAASGQTVTVNYATADNSAVAGSDYQPASGMLTFNPGDTTETVTVLVNGDTTFEQNETFFVTLSGPTNATILDSQGQGTIFNDDAAPPTPTLSINDVNIVEANSGTSIATFNVTLSPSSSQTVTVDFATANGTATIAGIDYQSATGTLTFNPGDTSKPISVTINGDTLVEPDETFLLNLTNATGGATIGTPFGTGTIQNDDTANLVISQVYGGGGNTGATFKNDFIEVFNRGTTTVDVAGWSVQYTSAAGTGAWSVTPLCAAGPCLLPPDRYFLVQEGQGAGGTSNLPTPDALGTIIMTTGAGKVALSSSTTPFSGSCPLNTNIFDIAGYGASATCFEGTGPTAAPDNSTADFRKAGGCTDTNDNAADFFVSAPFPRNTSSPTNNCTAGPAPNLTINDVTVAEGNSGTTTASFTVSLSAPAPSTDVTFDIATRDGTATTANSDYVARTLTNQIIPAGQTTYTFSVTVNSDLTIESDETFFVNVTNVSGTPVTDGQGLGTIQNDDLPTLSVNDASAPEGNSGTTTITFTVSLSAPAPATVTFDIATQDNSGTVADNDYLARSLSSQTIAAGQTTYKFAVTVAGDLNVEANESFFVNVTNVSGATMVDGQGVGTIQNDDSRVLSITPAVSVAEGDSGLTLATFTVTLSPASNQTITVDYATANGTATAGSDYQATNGTLTFSPLETTKPINVAVSGDPLVEPDETFTVSLSNASANASISAPQGTGTGTITNDDAPLVVISQVYGGGGNSGATLKNDFIEVFNRGTTTVDIAGWSVQETTDTGSATWSVTSLCTTGPCFLVPGKYFLVQEAAGAGGASNLPTPDATGTINVNGTAAKVALVSSTTALTGSCPSGANILDLVGYGNTASCFEGTGRAPAPSNTTADFRKSGGCLDTNDNAADFVTSAPNPRNSSSAANDCSTGFRPDISISDLTVTEGDSGTVNATFNVTLSAAGAQTVTVAFATADGTATAGADYQASSGTLTFNPGDLARPVTVQVNGDTLDEANETFFVNLSNATSAAILDARGQGTITDNDPTPSLSINDLPNIPEGDTGTSIANFTVNLSAASGQTVTVNYATADGTATVGSDYASTSGTLTFNPGETNKQIPVTINGDTTFEPNETFFVNLTTPVNATISDTQSQGTITNDDAAPPTPKITIDDPGITEGDTGTKTLNFTVSLSIPSAQIVTVDYATASAAPASGIATAGTDYVVAAGTVTFNPGQQSKPISITINGDKLVEPNENFFVNLSNASAGSTITDPQGVGTITNDDTPLLVISQIYGGGGNGGAAYQNDFVELFNRGTTTVDFSITPYSVQYASSTGTFSSTNKFDVTTGSLTPGQYFLVKLATGGAVGQTLTADITNPAINMSATDGKVALVIGTTVATTASGCPTAVTVADLLGYGTANCAEGTATAALSATKVAIRNNHGCTDTGANSTDFTTPTVNTSSALPRNSSSTLAPCP
jgi:Tol biopolymer transport system component